MSGRKGDGWGKKKGDTKGEGHFDTSRQITWVIPLKTKLMTDVTS